MMENFFFCEIRVLIGEDQMLVTVNDVTHE